MAPLGGTALSAGKLTMTTWLPGTTHPPFVTSGHHPTGSRAPMRLQEATVLPSPGHGGRADNPWGQVHAGTKESTQGLELGPWPAAHDTGHETSHKPGQREYQERPGQQLDDGLHPSQPPQQ